MIIKIKLADGNTLNLSNSDIVSSKIQMDASSDSELILGFASASSFNFSLKDLDEKYNNINFYDSKIEVYNDDETQKRGVFNLKKITKSKGIINFECLDNMTKFDVRFKGATFPISILDLIKVICNQCNVKVGNTINESLTNSNVIVKTAENFLGKNCREIIQQAAEICGCFAIFDENDCFQLKWFDLDREDKKEIEYDKLKDLEIDDSPTSIDGIEVYIDKKEYSYQSSGTYNLILTEDNIFFFDSSIDSYSIILSNIYNANLKNLKYNSFSLQTRVDDNIKLGDTIVTYDEKGNRLIGIVTNLDITNDATMNIISAGESQDRNYQNSSSSSSSDAGSGGAVEFGENLNFRSYTLTQDNRQVLNSFNIEGVTDKSNVFLNYLCKFSHNNDEVDLDFDFYINDKKIETIKEKSSNNNFNVAFKLPLDVTNSLNTIVIGCTSNNGSITIAGMDSKVTLISNDCSPDTAGNASQLNINDRLNLVKFTNRNAVHNFIIKDLSIVYNNSMIDLNSNSLSEIVEKINLIENIQDDLTICDISSNLL